MRKFICLLLFIPTLLFAEENRQRDVREYVYQTLLVTDWLQTRNIVKNPDKYKERNPVLGQHPSMQKVNKVVLLCGLGHYLISHTLTKDSLVTFQYITIGLEIGAITNNVSLGLSAKY